MSSSALCVIYFFRLNSLFMLAIFEKIPLLHLSGKSQEPKFVINPQIFNRWNKKFRIVFPLLVAINLLEIS